MVMAMAKTGAIVIASGMDATCPKYHASFRFSVPAERLLEFRKEIGCKLERIDMGSGQ